MCGGGRICTCTMYVSCHLSSKVARVAVLLRPPPRPLAAHHLPSHPGEEEAEGQNLKASRYMGSTEKQIGDRIRGSEIERDGDMQ